MIRKTSSCIQDINIAIKMQRSSPAKDGKSRKKSSSAYQQLRRIIEAGQIPVGKRLTEAEAIQLTGLGRGPVRESLLRLEAEGLLQQRGARRSRVVGYVEEENQQDRLLRSELREQIESGAARLAAKNMTGWQIERLCHLAQQVEHYFEIGDDERRYQAAFEFHEYLLANCGNPLMLQAWQVFRLTPGRPRTRHNEELIQSQIPVNDRDRPSWLDVAEAIARHDQDQSEQLAKRRIRHITEALRRVAWGDLQAEGSSEAVAIESGHAAPSP
jgi:DNA-binding GntR family transcriptional regulator